jgi:hypothetical protein
MKGRILANPSLRQDWINFMVETGETWDYLDWVNFMQEMLEETQLNHSEHFTQEDASYLAWLRLEQVTLAPS